MLDAKKVVIYVGKAKNLKKRLISYFNGKLDVKTAALVQNIVDIQLTVTHNEVEALLLECELIHRWQPRYNVTFKNGSKYPYIVLTKDEFPQLKYYRGAMVDGADYYGPFPNFYAVRENIDLIHKIFQIRCCENGVFKQRTRPCLQHQIKRCSAPCVGLITNEQYINDVDRARLFLKGNVHVVLQQLVENMQALAIDEKFEEAARLRDQITSLRTLLKQQTIVNTVQHSDLDIIAVAQYLGSYMIHVMIVRGGRVIGSDQHFPINKAKMDLTLNNVLEQYLLQHYIAELNKPKKIIINQLLRNEEQLTAALGINITSKASGQNKQLVEIAINSANSALVAKVSKEAFLNEQFFQLSNLLNKKITTIECIDISHNQGDSAMAAIVAFDIRGPVKSNYKRFNIKEAKGGDDCAAISEALTKHLTKSQSQGILADLLIIDGGKGQLHSAEKVVANLQIKGSTLISMAKGAARKVGLETIFTSSAGEVLNIIPDSIEFMLLARVRDEAHRFAITGHRNKIASKHLSSTLELIEGVGKKKRSMLLQQFGGLVEVKNATIEELASVPGINLILARRIYNALHQSAENKE
jgi:excinuclease ABC subunit C